MAEIEILDVPNDEHGEGPVWLPDEQALAWVDVYDDPSIQRYHPTTGTYRSLPTGRTTTCLAPCRGGGLLAAMQGGFHLIGKDGEIVFLADPSAADGQEQLNDGRCDNHGRFWCAALSRDLTTPRGRLFRLDPDGSSRHWDEGYLTGNGVAFSPAYDRLYVSDSRAETVWAYDFDADAGTIANKRQFFTTLGMAGRPDGASVDRDGNYWCALIQGAGVIAVSAEGRVVERLALPVDSPTMCAFGGENEDVLYVTTSRLRLDAQERRGHPEAGRLIAIHGLGVRGLPVTTFGR
jgi:sugar lactone lactonase YvrE